jgi:chromosomal replication initiator protein
MVSANSIISINSQNYKIGFFQIIFFIYIYIPFKIFINYCPKYYLLMNPSIVWETCLRSIKSEISEQSFKTWFEPIVPVKFADNTLTIQVPSKFFYEWLEENYVRVLRNAINNSIGHMGQLEYSVLVDKPSLKNTISVAQKNVLTDNQKGKSFVAKEPDFNRSPFELNQLDTLKQESYLNPSYMFSNFVEGDCNCLGRSAGIAVAAKPGATSFNPLMIYGGVGLGKTHILQAIGNEIKVSNPDKFVLYVSSEKFTNQFINAIKNSSLQVFSNFYMNVDVLIIDDVQFMAGKDKTQEIFFHIFNHLHQTGKQIIMSSDRAPKMLEGFMDRLLSRFKWGLTADLQKPDFETRIAIIEKKLENDGLTFSNEVIEYLAHTINTNVRELEGVLVSLMAHASLNRREVDLELAKKTLRGIVEKQEKVITMDSIFEAVKSEFLVSVDDIKSKSRKKEFILPRQMAMYLAKELLNIPLSNIGYYFDRDHSTVIYSVNSLNDALINDKLVQNHLAKLRKVLS